MIYFIQKAQFYIYINKYNKYEISYDASTDKGSSGSSIFLKNQAEVIGIHKQGERQKLR